MYISDGTGNLESADGLADDTPQGAILTQVRNAYFYEVDRAQRLQASTLQAIQQKQVEDLASTLTTQLSPVVEKVASLILDVEVLSTTLEDLLVEVSALKTRLETMATRVQIISVLTGTAAQLPGDTVNAS